MIALMVVSLIAALDATVVLIIIALMVVSLIAALDATVLVPVLPVSKLKHPLI